ncbi:MFS transporter [Palaeococcus ferrophilus]|uniref:MFS transporter n=1 Tax=Palaeococcus ferrophilus TaxID=83868 RepID=UPI00064E86B3|nr:MFS transporter [Palaeococcus ferrophilus]
MGLRNYLGFSRDAYLVVVYSFFGWLGGNIAWFVLPFYYRSLGMSYSQMGLLFSLSTISQAALLLIAGPLSVKIGYRRTIMTALAFFLAGRLLQILFPEFMFLAIASVLLGVGMALEGPALMSLLSEEASERNRHYLFSLNSALGTIGAGAGMLLGGFLPKTLDYRGTLEVAALFILIQLMAIALVSPVLKREAKRVHFEREMAVKLLKFSLPSALIGLGAGITIPYMGLWFNARFGTSLESIGGLFAFQQFIMGFLTFLLPMIADRFGSVRTIVGFNGSASALIAGMPFIPTFPLAAIVYTVRTILMNIVNPIWDAFMMRFFSVDERPTALALRNLAWTLTFGMGQYLGGLIFDRSLVIPFLLTGSLYGLSMATFWAFFKGEE